MILAIAFGSLGEIIKPFSPEFITSLIPPTFVAITGRPHDIPSKRTVGRPSCCDGITCIAAF